MLDPKLDIIYTTRTADSVTFDREALTLMLLQLDDQPTLQAFLERVMDELSTPYQCPECEHWYQFIREIKS